MRKTLSIFFLITLVVSMTLVVYATTNYYSASVIRKEQDKSLWCWVACAEMVAKSHVPDSTVTQSQAVLYVKNSVANVTGTLYDMQVATEYIANNEITCLKGNALTREATCRKLQSSYPIAAEITISGNQTNHAVVIYKVACDCQHVEDAYLRLSIYDPAQELEYSYEYSYDIMYDDFINGAYHTGYGKTLTWIKYVAKSGFASGV